jgi:hypothetical protein
MLDLRPPWFMIDGVLVAPDSVDASQYYAFPSSPHLATDGHGRPAVRLMVYKADLAQLPPDQEDAAGFLVLDTSLDWPADTLTRVARKLADQRNLADVPRLVPVPFTSGTVQFYVFDQASQLPGGGPPGGPGAGPGGGPGPGGDAGPVSTWVPRMLAAGMPSLYADNRAMLSATLSKRAAQTFEAAFGGFVPAGVVYDLVYVGLQPAFDITVEADWEQVYHHLFEGASARVFFFSSDISSAVDDLIDKKVINIKATIEGVGDEGMEGQFNEVRKLLQEWVIDKFFTPVPNPDQVDDHPIESRVMEVLRDLRTVGDRVQLGFTRREVDMTEVRTLSVDYSVARAVERRIAPQGHLSVVLADSGVPQDQVVTVVSGVDDQWRSLDFTLTAVADFGPQALQKADVFVWYGTSPDGVPPAGADVWSARLDAQHDVVTRSAWYRPETGTAFLYRYEAVFSPGAIVGPGIVLDSGWRTGEGARLTVVPGELYRERALSFQTALLPADVFPEVIVAVRYQDPDVGWVHTDSGLLQSGTSPPSLSFAFRTRASAPQAVGYQLTYLQPGSDPMVTDWADTTERLVVVRDPRHNLVHVKVLVGGDISKIRRLLLEFAYDDPDNGVHEEGSLDLDSTQLTQSHEWIFHRIDPAARRYRYLQTLVDVDGAITSTGWVEEDSTALRVGVLYALRWTIRPELIGPPLNENNLAMVKVHLRYRDDAHQYVVEQDFALDAPGEGPSWQLELRDASLRQYEYTLTYVTNTGVERRVGPRIGEDTFLTITSVPPV